MKVLLESHFLLKKILSPLCGSKRFRTVICCLGALTNKNYGPEYCNSSILAIKKEVVVGRELALLSHLGSGEPDDCVGGVLLDTTQRPPRLS